MGTLTGEATTEIDAPIERVWSVVEDVANAPDWQRTLHEIEPIEHDERGRLIVGDATTDAKVTRVKTRTRFEYVEPTSLRWEMVGKGDVKSMRGSWELEDLGDGRTRATYRLALDPGRLGLLVRGPIEAAVRAAIVGGRPGELAERVAAIG
jgi:uncharacterized protein YndB with AHSA1/START domain